MQKAARKNTKYLRNKTILKIGHHAKAITFAESSLGQELKFKKTSQNPLYKSFRVVLCKKTLEKALNIREMRPF